MVQEGRTARGTLSVLPCYWGGSMRVGASGLDD